MHGETVKKLCLYLLCFVLCVPYFCIVSFMYIYSYLLLVQGLLPPSKNPFAVNYYYYYYYYYYIFASELTSFH
jgi:hypothetical protein